MLLAMACSRAPLFLPLDPAIRYRNVTRQSLASPSTSLFTTSLTRRHFTRKASPASLCRAKGGSSVEAVDRLISATSYFLPLFDGIQYGRFLFTQFPVAEQLIEPLFPVLRAYKSFPYASFVAFFALYLTVVRNQSFSRYVRFNAMQAVVLDVLTIVPSLVERTFGASRGFGYTLLVSFYNTVFIFLVASFAYGVISCVLGRTARLPLVADAADAQI